jgi:membrane protease subunit HflK
MSEGFDPNKYLPKLSPTVIVIILIAILVVTVVATSIYTVEPNEKAVILFLGELQTYVDASGVKQPVLHGPGMHFKMPFGIEKNYNVPTESELKKEYGFRTVSAGIETQYSENYPHESIMLTGDKNIVDVQWVVQFRIVDPVAWLFNVRDPERMIRDVSQSVLNQLVGDKLINVIITTARTEIEEQGRILMNKMFQNYNLGINVSTVALKNVLPPRGPVRDAFEDLNKADQDSERSINEGKELYNKAIEEAQGEAAGIIAEAEGYKQKRINEAEGDVARFIAVYEEYRKARDVTRTRLYIEMIEEVFGSIENTDLIDKNLSNFIPFKALTEGGTSR